MTCGTRDGCSQNDLGLSMRFSPVARVLLCGMSDQESPLHVLTTDLVQLIYKHVLSAWASGIAEHGRSEFWEDFDMYAGPSFAGRVRSANHAFAQIVEKPSEVEAYLP